MRPALVALSLTFRRWHLYPKASYAQYLRISAKKVSNSYLFLIFLEPESSKKEYMDPLGLSSCGNPAALQQEGFDPAKACCKGLGRSWAWGEGGAEAAAILSVGFLNSPAFTALKDLSM